MTLAQAARPDLTTLYIALGLLILTVIAGGIVLLAMRRRLLRAESPRHESLMDELRRMHKSGSLTPEEYDRARRALARSAAGLDTARSAGPTTTAPQRGGNGAIGRSGVGKSLVDRADDSPRPQGPPGPSAPGGPARS